MTSEFHVSTLYRHPFPAGITASFHIQVQMKFKTPETYVWVAKESISDLDLQAYNARKPKAGRLPDKEAQNAFYAGCTMPNAAFEPGFSQFFPASVPITPHLKSRSL